MPAIRLFLSHPTDPAQQAKIILKSALYLDYLMQTQSASPIPPSRFLIAIYVDEVDQKVVKKNTCLSAFDFSRHTASKDGRRYYGCMQTMHELQKLLRPDDNQFYLQPFQHVQKGFHFGSDPFEKDLAAAQMHSTESNAFLFILFTSASSGWQAPAFFDESELLALRLERLARLANLGAHPDFLQCLGEAIQSSGIRSLSSSLSSSASSTTSVTVAPSLHTSSVRKPTLSPDLCEAFSYYIDRTARPSSIVSTIFQIDYLSDDAEEAFLSPPPPPPPPRYIATSSAHSVASVLSSLSSRTDHVSEVSVSSSTSSSSMSSGCVMTSSSSYSSAISSHSSSSSYSSYSSSSYSSASSLHFPPESFEFRAPPSGLPPPRFVPSHSPYVSSPFDLPPHPFHDGGGISSSSAPAPFDAISSSSAPACRFGANCRSLRPPYPPCHFEHEHTAIPPCSSAAPARPKKAQKPLCIHGTSCNSLLMKTHPSYRACHFSHEFESDMSVSDDVPDLNLIKFPKLRFLKVKTSKKSAPSSSSSFDATDPSEPKGSILFLDARVPADILNRFLICLTTRLLDSWHGRGERDCITRSKDASGAKRLGTKGSEILGASFRAHEKFVMHPACNIRALGIGVLINSFRLSKFYSHIHRTRLATFDPMVYWDGIPDSTKRAVLTHCSRDHAASSDAKSTYFAFKAMQNLFADLQMLTSQTYQGGECLFNPAMLRLTPPAFPIPLLYAPGIGFFGLFLHGTKGKVVEAINEGGFLPTTTTDGMYHTKGMGAAYFSPQFCKIAQYIEQLGGYVSKRERAVIPAHGSCLLVLVYLGANPYFTNKPGPLPTSGNYTSLFALEGMVTAHHGGSHWTSQHNEVVVYNPDCAYTLAKLKFTAAGESLLGFTSASLPSSSSSSSSSSPPSDDVGCPVQ